MRAERRRISSITGAIFMKFGRAPTTLIIRSIALVQKAELKLRQEVYSWLVFEHKGVPLTLNNKTPESPKASPMSLFV